VTADRSNPRARVVAPIVALAALTVALGASRAQDGVTTAERGERLARVESEIAILRGEIKALAGREEGVLAELERAGAERALAEREHEAAALRLAEIGAAIESRTELLQRIEESQGSRRAYLSARVREIYKEGPAQALRRLVGIDTADRRAGLGYATLLAERDLETLGAYRDDRRRWITERAELESQHAEQAQATAQLAAAVERLEAAERRQRGSLDAVRRDRRKTEQALADLETAARELSRVAGEVGSRSATLDVRALRGTLEPPVAGGKVTSPFGTAVHPRFKTRVPHPGWDIEAELGADIRSVLDGTVAYAGWMRGYGLTAIVDHGGGLLSIYAHASVLLVEAGERVTTGHLLGKVGDTGSLRGPFLYFELRVDGEPADPAGWLRTP
jgi:septal ring factor EnvC (AmiA/AmiB activator)